MCFSKKLNDKLGKFSPATKALVGDAFVNPEDTSARDAAEAERQRQARISANVKNINAAYAGREGQYADFAKALREQYSDDLGRQNQTAARNLKFAMAGSGLTGGSTAIDTGRDLSREMARGTVAAESKVRQQEAGLRNQDEQSRLQMISLAQTGGDIGNAATQTANSLRANLDAARGGATANTLGEIFGGTAQTYKAMQEAANLRRGLKSSSEQIYAAGIGRPYGR